MVLKEDAENTVDSERDESGSAVNGWSHQWAYSCNYDRTHDPANHENI